MSLNTPKYIPYNPELKDCIIIDIDGTISHTDNRRWIHDYDKVYLDTFDPCMFKFLEQMNIKNAIFITWRSEWCRNETYEWLGNKLPQNIRIYNLIMRKEWDRRHDDIVKKEIFELFIRNKYNILAVFEDRDRVVKMYRELWLLTFQVNYWDF